MFSLTAVDQPPGTGLSTVPVEGYVEDLQQAGEHLIHFISNFYKVFPEFEGMDVSYRPATKLTTADVSRGRVVRWTVHPLLW